MNWLTALLPNPDIFLQLAVRKQQYVPQARFRKKGGLDAAAFAAVGHSQIAWAQQIKALASRALWGNFLGLLGPMKRVAFLARRAKHPKLGLQLSA